MKRLVFSYIRFSDASQAKGDSAERQAEFVQQFCKTNNLTLDQRTFKDFGKSGFATRRAGVKGNALQLKTAQDGLQSFLDAVQSGDIPEGSILVVEALDRLSRQAEEDALGLLLAIIAAGIEVIALKPDVIRFKKGAIDVAKLMLAVVYLAQAHAYSRNLSTRLGAWWQKTRDEKRQLPRVPAWIIRNAEGGYTLDRSKTKAIERIYQLCIDGEGIDSITRRLLVEKVPPIAKKNWSSSYVASLLECRQVIGEYQPHQGRTYDRKKVGDPIPNYYPPAIDLAKYNAAQAAKARRFHKSGRMAKGVNLFQGLLFDAISGFSYWRQGETIIVGRERLATTDKSCRKFPYAFLEQALLKATVELNAFELMPSAREEQSKRRQVQDDLAVVTERLRKINKLLDGGKDYDSVLDQLVATEERKKALLAELEDMHSEPFVDSFGEYVSAAKFDADHKDDKSRMRLGSLVRRIISRISVAVSTQGIKKPHRAFIAQIEFVTGEVRHVFGVKLFGEEPEVGSELSLPSDGLKFKSGKWWESYVGEFLSKRIASAETKNRKPR